MYQASCPWLGHRSGSGYMTNIPKPAHCPNLNLTPTCRSWACAGPPEQCPSRRHISPAPSHHSCPPVPGPRGVCPFSTGRPSHAAHPNRPNSQSALPAGGRQSATPAGHSCGSSTAAAQPGKWQSHAADGHLPMACHSCGEACC